MRELREKVADDSDYRVLLAAALEDSILRAETVTTGGRFF
jgi:hypothetical protein